MPFVLVSIQVNYYAEPVLFSPAASAYSYNYYMRSDLGVAMVFHLSSSNTAVSDVLFNCTLYGRTVTVHLLPHWTKYSIHADIIQHH